MASDDGDSATEFLFPHLRHSLRARPRPAADTEGVLPGQQLAALIEAGAIGAPAATPIQGEQIQPASLDLRLGRRVYRVQCSFLPGERSVGERLAELTLYSFDMGDESGGVLERNCVYIIPLVEHLDLSGRAGRGLHGIATPKSSTGRLDVFARLLADYSMAFEQVGEGYAGPLYLEVSPRTFPIRVRPGDSLNQIRLRRGQQTQMRYAARERLQRKLQRVRGAADTGREGLWLSVNLTPRHPGAPVAYRARRNAGVIDLRRVGHYEIGNFWERIYAGPRCQVVLTPDDFYLFASKQRIWVPPSSTAEMVAFDTTAGEFRAHYAGFFDPGFGMGGQGDTGTPAVLEVRSHEVPFLLEDNQAVARLVYEQLVESPDKLYGTDIGSHYARQSLTPAKQFRPDPEA